MSALEAVCDFTTIQQLAIRTQVFSKVACLSEMCEERSYGDSTPRIEKNLYHSFDCDENLHTQVKAKIKRGNSLELFPFSS